MLFFNQRVKNNIQERKVPGCRRLSLPSALALNIQEMNSMTRKRRPQRHPMPQPQPLPPAANPQLSAAILEIVDTQLRDRTPPETHATFARLIGLGYTPEGARQLLANVVVREIFTVMARGESYDAARFVAALHRLPALSDDTEAGE